MRQDWEPVKAGMTISGSVRGMYSEIRAVEINYDGGSFMSPSSEGEERSFQEIQQEIKLARML